MTTELKFSKAVMNHVVMDAQNGEFRCTHCGEYKAIRMPCPVDDFVKTSTAFVAQHKHCKPAEAKPQVEADKKIPIDDHIVAWLSNGERGTSSNTIVYWMTGMQTLRDFAMSHPSDPADLMRCRKLVDSCPSIRENFHLMRDCSPVWSSLVDRWQELCDLMDHEAPHWDTGHGSAPQTYDLMKKIGC